jgi:hypothetical protein
VGLPAAAALAFVVVSSLFAQAPRVTEYHVKATYLYNFGQFVRWPADSLAPEGRFRICVLGLDPFGSILDASISNETIAGRAVVIARISTSQEAASCSILFISSSEERQLERILLTLDKANVLTVSDMPNFAQRGGMIQFTKDGSRIRFAVNLSSAEEAGLALSSELLKVAVSVRRRSSPGD